MDTNKIDNEYFYFEATDELCGLDMVYVKIGEVDHPMTDDHYITWVAAVYDDSVLKYNFKPGEVPVFWACGVTPQSVLMNVKPDFEAISQKNSVLVHQLSGMVFNNTDILLLSFLCDFKNFCCICNNLLCLIFSSAYFSFCNLSSE